MRFIHVRRPEQIDLQAPHRVRSRIVANAAAVEKEANELTTAMRSVVASLMDDCPALEVRLQSVDREIERLARSDVVANRLTTIPDIRPLCATALIAAIGNGKQFKRPRDLAA